MDAFWLAASGSAEEAMAAGTQPRGASRSHRRPTATGPTMRSSTAKARDVDPLRLCPKAFGLPDAFGLPAQMAILPSLVGQAREQPRTRGPRLFLMLELYGLSSRSP